MIFDKDLSLNYLTKHPASRFGSFELGITNFYPIFVIGCPRSGTTLLGRCLGASSKAFVGRESVFLIDMWRLYSDLFSGVNRRNHNPLSDYTSESNLLKYIADFSHKIYSDALERSSSAVCIDHTPWYGLLMPFIKTLFPNAKFVHIIRGGIEVANSLNVSYKKGFLWCGENFLKRYEMWESFINQIREHATPLNPADYIEVKFEELCNDPYRLLTEKLCPFTGLDFEEKMLEAFLIEHASPSRKEVIQFYKDSEGKIIKKTSERPFCAFEGDDSIDFEAFKSKFSYLFENLNYPIN